MPKVNPNKSPVTNASSSSPHQQSALARIRLLDCLGLPFLLGCLLGYVLVPHFGHPSGHPNVAIGGIAGLLSGLVLYTSLRIGQRLAHKAGSRDGIVPTATQSQQPEAGAGHAADGDSSPPDQ